MSDVGLPRGGRRNGGLRSMRRSWREFGSGSMDMMAMSVTLDYLCAVCVIQ